MAEEGELPAGGNDVPVTGGSPPPATHCGGEGESSGPGGPVRGKADGEPHAVPIAGVSRRFNVGHLLVAVGLFAVLFCFLRLLRAPPVAYMVCALFCVAISLGQMYLYQGRQPRRASCLVGGRLFPLLCIGGLMVFYFHDVVRELRHVLINGRYVAEFATGTLFLAIGITVTGYLFGYFIGTISAGIFLVIDRRWDAGKRADGGTAGVGPGGASMTGTSQIPPTGKWWLDWIAWSPVLWFWRNRRRPVRTAIVLSVLIAPFYLLGIPVFWASRFQQAYLLGAGMLVPLIGLSLSGVLYAGWRPPLVCCPLAIAAVAYPLFIFTRDSWLWTHVWQYTLPDISPVGLTACTGIVLGLVAAGFYGWVRWTLAAPVEETGRRRLGMVILAGFMILLVPLGLNVQCIVDLERREIDYLTLEDQHLSEGDLRALARLPNLKWLVILDCHIARGSLRELEALSQLTALNLSGSILTGEDLRVLRNLPALERVGLCRTNVSDAQLEQLASVRRLKSLSLDEAHITGPGLMHLQSLPQLRRLDLRRSNVTDEDLQFLRHLPYCPSLASLSLSETNISDAGLEHLAATIFLKRLSLHRTNVTGRGLAHLKDLRQLVSLDLSGAPVSDEGLSHLPPLPELHSLDLSCTRVTGDGLRHVKRLPALRYLDCSECDIQDDDLQVLYDYPIWWIDKKESGLDFSATDVTEEGQRALEDAWRALENGVDEPPGDELDLGKSDTGKVRHPFF